MKAGLGIGPKYPTRPLDGQWGWAEPEVAAWMNFNGINDNSTLLMAGTAQEITSHNFGDAVNNAVIAVKNTLGLTLGQMDLSTRAPYWNPFLLDTSSIQRLNMSHVGVFTGTFNGGNTHNGTGYQPNGTNGYFNAGVSMASAGLSRTSISMHFMSKTDTNGSFIDIGTTKNSAPQWDMIMGARFSGNFLSRFGTVGFNDITAVANSLGFYSVSRRSATEYIQYKNGVLVSTQTDSSPNDQNTLPIFVGAWNNDGVPNLYSPRKYTHAIMADGWTGAEVLGVYNALAALDTALNR